MGLATMLASLLHPCAHIDKTVATMFDDPSNPKVTTVVSECEICGRLKQTVFRAEGVCQHQWVTDNKSAVWEKPTDKFPAYHRIEQHCSRCGEVRAVDMRPEKWETQNGVARSTGRGRGGQKSKPAGTSESVANAP